MLFMKNLSFVVTFVNIFAAMETTSAMNNNYVPGDRPDSFKYFLLSGRTRPNSSSQGGHVQIASREEMAAIFVEKEGIVRWDT